MGFIVDPFKITFHRRDFAEFRSYELAATLNRFRALRVKQRPGTKLVPSDINLLGAVSNNFLDSCKIP
ncbi:hypothetical protein S225a_06040 [Candidatus Brocadiaceae bacterium S225]|nr:hypothetical protein S225a_06040 [Candidatus Brocadiaceae bacterium S225]